MIQALRQVPETRLRIIELAWKVVREDGTLDPAIMAFYSKELTEAFAEARGYISATEEVVRCLKKIARY